MTKILRRLLREVLSEEELEHVAGGYDLIGDIAVLRISDKLPPERRKLVGEKLIEAMPNIRSVWNQVGPVSGDYRIRGLEHLAGERRTLTLYKEHGCSYLVDVAHVYFSPRLSGERLRVALMVKPGETVYNMFAGVGPFSILIAKHASRAVVYSSEINPWAYKLMLENIVLNRVSGSVVPLYGDAFRHVKGMRGLDRVLLPLPEKALDALPLAARSLRRGGVAHIYLHLEGRPDVAVKSAIKVIGEKCSVLEAFYGRVVREVAPRVYQVVVDAAKM
jgi:tRNA (guanine37-N1)-methyltransferase